MLAKMAHTRKEDENKLRKGRQVSRGKRETFGREYKINNEENGFKNVQILFPLYIRLCDI